MLAALTLVTTLFNHPSIDGTTDGSLQDSLMQLVDQAAPGSTLRVATYVLEVPEFEQKLEAAYRRGVDVKVVAEGSDHDPLLDTLATALGPGRVTLCQLGCLGPDKDIMHEKFFVFSRLTDGRTDVVVQTSQNVSTEYGLHQNMIITDGDVGLANGYRNVFDRLASQVQGTWQAPFTSDSGKITVWMSPRDATYDQNTYGNSDLVAAQLSNVTCPASIRIVQSQFATDRPNVISVLKTKKQQGCQVEVITAEGAGPAAVGKQLAQAGIGVFTFRPGGCHYPVRGTCAVDSIHSKYILAGNIVYTGSQNLVAGSLLYADDAFVKVDDPAVYQAFDADYKQLKDETVKLHPATYPNAALTMAADGPDDQREPRAAASATGYTAVTWEDASTAEVYARIYHNDQPVTGPVKVSMGGVGCATGWNHIRPDVGLDDAGNAYVAWAEDGDCRGEHNIAVRRLTPAGALSSTIWANDPQWAGDQNRPTIAVRGTGAFTVAWEDTPSGSIRAAGYSSFGTRSFGPVAVTGAVSATRPDAAIDGTGATTLVWEQYTDIYMGKISATGTVTLRDSSIDPRVPVNTNTAAQHLAPAVAVTSTGDSVVAWSDNLNGIWRVRLRGLAPSMAARWSERAAAQGLYAPGQTPDESKEYPPMCDTRTSGCAVQGTPFVGLDGSGRAVVSWTESDWWAADRGYEVYARGLNADGSTTGRFPVERMNPMTVGDQATAPVAVAPDGSFTLFYADDFDANGYRDIVARSGFTNTTY
ncbi:phosphatidylserine/phosphatidylglycerophosphate/cardiolipin synthase family protein [Nonomuraea sp. NPDC050536]|uniref:phosphatidylserine/phosphatidylglycerophosphate/ cardiolipin synthase family protein n=1 Tax=Nonomuraea sp. NPDC050536 TaxID=3364366 RepID=UPI0037C73F52